ncbi:hypothetical protein ACNVED_05695 [Legionella sp. D16C41]
MASTSGGSKKAGQQNMSAKDQKGGKSADHKKSSSHQSMSEKGQKGGRK